MQLPEICLFVFCFCLFVCLCVLVYIYILTYVIHRGKWISSKSTGSFISAIKRLYYQPIRFTISRPTTGLEHVNNNVQAHFTNIWTYWILSLIRISRFSAWALAIFTEYTAWAAFWGMPRSALQVCFLLLKAKQNMQMKYLNMQMRYILCVSTTKKHMDNTWVHCYPLPGFDTLAHTVLCIFVFLVISQSEQICKWDIY